MEYMYVTPCVSVCQIDRESRLCKGCGRSIDQITNWTKYSHDKRMDIMKELGYGKRTSKKDRLAKKQTRAASKAGRTD